MFTIRGVSDGVLSTCTDSDGVLNIRSVSDGALTIRSVSDGLFYKQTRNES